MQKALIIAIFLLGTPAYADTINHINALGSFFGGQQTIAATFDWNVTTQSIVQNSASIISTGYFQNFVFGGAVMNLASWYIPSQPYTNFQIDFKDHWPTVQNSFNNEGSYGFSQLELWTCNICALPLGYLGGRFEAESGHIIITDPVETPEPQTWFLIMAGVSALLVMFMFKPRMRI